MDWLKDHVYLATWFGLPLAVILAIVQAKKSQPFKVNWFRAVITFSFFLSLAVVFTPSFDAIAREFARFLAAFLLGAIIVNRNE